MFFKSSPKVQIQINCTSRINWGLNSMKNQAELRHEMIADEVVFTSQPMQWSLYLGSLGFKSNAEIVSGNYFPPYFAASDW